MKSSPGSGISVVLGVFILGLWVLLFRSLAAHWSIGQQYSYGWVVPLLIAYIVVQRWKSRPAPGPATRSGYWVAVLSALAFLPTWFVLQPNPDWRTLNWLFALEITGMTLGVVALLGGRPWTEHFAFPCLFVFAAIPWPRPLEIPFVEKLSRFVTEVGVVALNFSGVSAVPQGNVIEVQSGLLGVEEACSGIQSLQATLMASLFFGEFFGLSVLRRFLLLLAGIGVALLTNISRTYYLAWHAAHSSLASMEKMHDLAANVAMTLCFVLVWMIGQWFSPAVEAANPPAPAGRLPHPVAKGFLWTLTIWMVLVLVAAEFWYHDPAYVQAEWTMSPPPSSTPIPISKWTADLLLADESKTGNWMDSDGYRWQLYFFRWNAGPVRSRLLAQLHRPEICLPSTGLVLSNRRTPISVTVGGVHRELNAFTFTQNGAPTFVYWGAWENRSPRAAQSGDLSNSLFEAALQSVAWRERHLGQEVVEIALSGCVDAEEADNALQRMFPALIVEEAP